MHHDHIEALHTVRDLGLRIKPGDVSSLDVTVHPPFTDLRTVQSLIDGERLPLGLVPSTAIRGPRAFTARSAPRCWRASASLCAGRALRAPPDLRHDRRGGALTLRRAAPRDDPDPLRRRDRGVARRRRDQLAPGSPGRTALTGLAKEQWGHGPCLRADLAIGTGRAATVDDAQDACAFIRSWSPRWPGACRARPAHPVRGSVKAPTPANWSTHPTSTAAGRRASLDAAGLLTSSGVSDCYRSSAA